MALISASRFTELKARVKAECQRRAYNGSVSTYGGTAYDYSTTPASGGKILSEHQTKLRTPLSKINSSVISATDSTKINDADLTAMEAFVTTCESRKKTDSSGTDCKSSCTGLCYGCTGTCTGTCTSCTGCTGCTSCSGTCEGCTGCTGCTSCTASCADSCQVDCSNVCWDGCYLGCTGGCGGGCIGGCSSTCTTSCWDGCYLGCTSCTGSS